MNEEDKSLGFVKRWIKAFNRIVGITGGRVSAGNRAFVDDILKDETDTAVKDEKRRILESLCDETDSYYRKKAEAEKAPDLNAWMHGQVERFAHDVIPDADASDVADIERQLAEASDAEIARRRDLLKDEFTPNDDKI